jgi:cytochrome c biogenesis protein CcdA/thiol-disulfide isomerase/thioredoxin
MITLDTATPRKGARVRAGRLARWGIALLILICVPSLVEGASSPAEGRAPAIPERSDDSPIASSSEEAVLWYFWTAECPVCRRAAPWLEKLEENHPGLMVRRVDVARDLAGRALFFRMMEERGGQPSAVPTFILEDEVWVGFTPSLADDVEAAVRARLGDPVRDRTRDPMTLDLGPFGRLALGAQPMSIATVLIAFVDGFNPCSLWVLTVLLAMILGTGSRARVVAVGLTFLLVTAAVYGAFIVGVFAALEVATHMGWIRVAVALLALAFGAVNVKEFLAPNLGPSLTIPDRFKPTIYRGGRAIREDRPLPVTLAITAGMAGGVALIELPCTAGFPVLWTTLLAEAGVAAPAFAGLLLLYLLVYLSVEIALLAGAVVTLRATRLQEEHGRTLKLFGGMVMIALAGVLLVDPAIMEALAGSLAVVGLAVAASVVLLIVARIRARNREPGDGRSPPPSPR